MWSAAIGNDLLFRFEVLQMGFQFCDGRPHLGMGLYVARTIAEYHSGQLQADNRTDVAGVEVKLLLPDTI